MREQDEGTSTSTRRGLIVAGSAGAAAALLAGHREARAAVGQPVVQGVVNNAGGGSTEVRSTSVNPTVVGRNSGTGAAAFFRSENSNGFAGGSNSPNYFGLSAANYSGTVGNGGAVAAVGNQNRGVEANTQSSFRAAVLGRSLSSEYGGGAGVAGQAENNFGVAGIGFPGVIGSDPTWAPPENDPGDSFGVVSEGDAWIRGVLYAEGGIVEGSPPKLEEVARFGWGTATLDANGRADVAVEVAGADLLYQLTPLGGPAPDLHVAREADGGSFSIAGGNPGQRVSWRVDSPPTGAPETAEAVVQKAEALRARLDGHPRRW